MSDEAGPKQYDNYSMFLADMIVNKPDFDRKLAELSGGKLSPARIDYYFNQFVRNLYDCEVKNVRKPGLYDSADLARKEAMARDTIFELVREVGGLSGQFGMWSQTGRAAIEDPEIQKAAGASGQTVNLEKTAVGSFFCQAKIFNDPRVGYERTHCQWAGLSAVFASSAKGEIEVFVPLDIDGQSIFWGSELPELRKHMAPISDKPTVKKITVFHIKEQLVDAIKSIDDERKKLDKLARDRPLTREEEARRSELVASKDRLLKDPRTWVKKDLMDASINKLEMKRLADFGTKWQHKAKQPALHSVVSAAMASRQTPQGASERSERADKVTKKGKRRKAAKKPSTLRKTLVRLSAETKKG